MKFADGTHTVVAQKFVGIEHAPQQTFHAMTAGEGDKPALAHARLVPAGDETAKIGTISEVPFETRFETGQRFDQLPLDRFHRQ